MKGSFWVFLLAFFLFGALPVQADVFTAPSAGGRSLLPSDGTRQPCPGTLLTHVTGAPYADRVAWESIGVVPPYYGAFADYFDPGGSVAICALFFDFTRLGGESWGSMDVYLWDDDPLFHRPGGVRRAFTGISIPPDSIGIWPASTRHWVSLTPSDLLPAWIGYWGAWPGEPACFYLCVETNVPTPGTPMTNVAPGMNWTEGWHALEEIFPMGRPGKSLAVGAVVEAGPTAACCTPSGLCSLTTEGECLAPNSWHPEWTSCDPNPCPAVPVHPSSWGMIKALYR